MIHQPSNLLQALEPVVDALGELGVPYHVGGSVASSVYGVARSTLDVDLVAHLPVEKVAPLVERLQHEYYIDARMAEEAVTNKSSFNLIHLPTMIKVDIFVPTGDLLDRPALLRARMELLGAEYPDAGGAHRRFYVTSPEDIVLRKLQWYQAGGQLSERQWHDILGVLKVQAGTLDRGYLQEWAGPLDLSTLLARATEEAGYD